MPEAKLIRNELVLRDMTLSPEARSTKKSLIRWFALASGLIAPNESRHGVLPVLEALFHFQLAKGSGADTAEICEYIKKAMKQEADEKSVRYHLLRLRRTGFVERLKGKYGFVPSHFSDQGDLASSFENAGKERFESALVKIKEALSQLAKMY